MTFDEILRVAEPTTELEMALIEKFNEAVEDRAEEISEQFRDIKIDELDDALSEQVALNTRIEYLEELLDEHEIKYIK
jgi:hypothetical protein